VYRWLRNLHLGVGLFFAIFLLGFGLSAVQMAYRLPGPNTTETTATIEDVPAGYQVNPRAFAWWLMNRHGLGGDLGEVKTDGAIVYLTITRTGAIHRVAYDSRAGTARVTTTSRNALGLLNRIHHASGITHDYWAVNGWGWALLTTSCALLVLAITGIVMWFKRHEDRVLGALVTSIGLVWGVTLLVLMRTR
jgi:hypothetical protein